MQLSLHRFYLLANAWVFKAKSSKRECGGAGGTAVKDTGAGRLAGLGVPGGPHRPLSPNNPCKCHVCMLLHIKWVHKKTNFYEFSKLGKNMAR